MKAIDPILEELDREAKTTRRVLERIPQDNLAWKPHPKSKPIGELAWHVATIPKRIATFAQQDEADVLSVKAPPMPATTAEILAGFDQHVAEARQLLAQIDEQALARQTTIRRGDLVLFSAPKSEILRGMLLNHGYHHRGQLTVYLRLLDIPVPSVYGPTADES
jgi:uncharacterized damage-inducible protein DinB